MVLSISDTIKCKQSLLPFPSLVPFPKLFSVEYKSILHVCQVEECCYSLECNSFPNHVSRRFMELNVTSCCIITERQRACFLTHYIIKAKLLHMNVRGTNQQTQICMTAIGNLAWPHREWYTVGNEHAESGFQTFLTNKSTTWQFR